MLGFSDGRADAESHFRIVAWESSSSQGGEDVNRVGGDFEESDQRPRKRSFHAPEGGHGVDSSDIEGENLRNTGHMPAKDNLVSMVRPVLPFGAVMAAGVASELAGAAGVGSLRLPLLWVTVAIAVAISLIRFLRIQSGELKRSTRSSCLRLGEFTVPIGAAVVGSGFARMTGTWALWGAACAVGVACSITVFLVLTRFLPLIAVWPGIVAIDGTWFLVPAALLADAAGIANLERVLPISLSHLLGWLALAAVGIGAVGYLAVLVLAGIRLATLGIGGVARAPWWIAAGCGGLTAAALGIVSSRSPFGTSSRVIHSFGWLALGYWIIGSAILLPVLFTSVWFFMKMREFQYRPPWPPTFSTGVYALGAAQVGRLLALPLLATVAGIAAAATISMWAVTVLGHLVGLARNRRVFNKVSASG